METTLAAYRFHMSSFVNIPVFFPDSNSFQRLLIQGAVIQTLQATLAFQKSRFKEEYQSKTVKRHS